MLIWDFKKMIIYWPKIKIIIDSSDIKSDHLLIWIKKWSLKMIMYWSDILKKRSFTDLIQTFWSLNINF